jgi:hypothetical protein
MKAGDWYIAISNSPPIDFTRTKFIPRSVATAAFDPLGVHHAWAEGQVVRVMAVQDSRVRVSISGFGHVMEQEDFERWFSPLPEADAIALQNIGRVAAGLLPLDDEVYDWSENPRSEESF